MQTLETFTAEQTLSPVDRLTGLTEELNDPNSLLHQEFYNQETGVTPTPVWQMPDQVAGHTLFVKDETDHRVVINGTEHQLGSFKRRGAYAAALTVGRDADVLVAASAGNHAQGVAAAAALTGKKAELHVTHGISEVKERNNKALGADLVHHDSLEDALFTADLETDGVKRVNIHPFDQAEVIAGQATMVEEWLQSMEAAQADDEVDLFNDELTLVVPVGGGGLIAAWGVGLELARQQGRLGGNVRLVGAQMERCDAMNRALQLGDSYRGGPLLSQTALNEKSDGTAVAQPGSLTFELAQRYVSEIVVLTPAEVGEAMTQLGDTLQKDVEPAGALAYAAAQKLMQDRPNTTGRRSLVTCVASGANVSDETKQYFSDQVTTAAAQRNFAARSAEYLRNNTSYKALMGSAVKLSETGGTSVSAAPTAAFRQNPHTQRDAYLASLAQ